MNGEPTWISSSALRTLSATVVFLNAWPRNQTDRQFSIYLPKSNKSKKTRAIQFNQTLLNASGTHRCRDAFVECGSILH